MHLKKHYLPILFSLSIGLTLTACSFQKVSKVDIENANDYPISLTIRTNNIQETYSGIKPKERISKTYDWTKLDSTEGQFVLFVKNEQSGGVDSFTHGFIRRGELYNYLYLKSEGSELKVEISN
jgi:hypothetical protein